MKANCITGVTLNEGDPVRVVILAENVVMASQLPYYDEDKAFKAIGLPFPATYIGQGLFKAEYSSQLKATEIVMQNDLRLKQPIIEDLDRIILKMRDGQAEVTPFQAKAKLSYMFIDESVYQMLLEEEDAFSQTLEDYVEKYTKIFKETMSIVSEKEDCSPELQKFMTESLKRTMYSDCCPKARELFLRTDTLMSLCEEKNRDHFINAIFAFSILGQNECKLKPFITSNTSVDQKISIMQDIQNVSLTNYDYELKEFCNYDVDYTYIVKEKDFKRETGKSSIDLINKELRVEDYPEMEAKLPKYVKTFFIEQGEA